jgi:hypothetical protein
MFQAFLNRIKPLDNQTLGILNFYDDLEEVFSCKTVELPYRANLRCISSINTGVYTVQRRWSEAHKEHLHIMDVKGRTLILIHVANYVRELLGCVAVGEKFADIDGDGTIDITSSRKTLDIILSLMIERNITEFQLTIN